MLVISIFQPDKPADSLIKISREKKMRERESSSLEDHLLEEQLDQSPAPSTTAANNPLPRKQLSLLPLVFLIYFEVAGGPYGEEPSVRAAGPLFAILGFLIFPFIWSVPEALITAELATAFPGNGGYVVWAHEAFGPFWASLMGSWKFLSGVINLASYPVLCIDYIKLVFPIFSSGFFHYFAILVSTLGLSFLNYSGLAIVGFSAVVLGVMSILPFVILTLFSIPKIDPRRWVSLGQVGVAKDWRLFFNTLFWNLNFWDNVSTLAGEVEKPQSTYPKALLSAGLFACLAYLIPLLAATGAIPLVQENWVDGYFADVAQIIVGKWLKIFVEMGACLSIIGLYEAQLSNCAYQILGMTELGILPKSFEQRSKFFGTPWVGILISTLIALVVSYMNFEDIISTVNFLYSLGMLLEFASFLWLRKKFPKINRPFKVPMEMGGLVILCLIPSVFLVYVIIVAHMKVYLISGALTIFGICWYLLMNLCKAKMWFQFNKIVARENLNDELIY